MAKLTIVIGGLLIALGVVGFAIPGPTGARSWTALIPAFAGALMEVFGALALNPKFRMHAMHGAVLISLLAFLAAVGALIARRPTGMALFSMSAMAVLTGLHVALSVRSFINARRDREAGGVV